MSSYFYCYSLPLAAGSVINPGNWGRILRMYTQQTNAQPWVLIRELAYEGVRRQQFPAKPSRFDGLFVCETEADLKDFRMAANRRLDIGYEVELVDPSASCHRGDRTLPNLQPTDDLPTFETRAVLYWQGTSIMKPELLTLSSIRIVRQLP